jgi:hypothetical protein
VSSVGLEARAIVRAGIGLAFPDLVLPGFPGDDQRDPAHPLHQLEYFERARLMQEHPELRPAEPDSRADAVRQVQRPAIPFSRLQQLLRDLLGQHDLSNIRGLTVDLGAIEVEVFALDDRGRKYLRGVGADRDVAVDRIHIPVARS